MPAGYGEAYKHRHLSHLHAAYEANGELTPEKTPQLWRAAQEATQRRIDSGGERSSHGRVHMGLAAAYLRLGEEAYGRVAVMATGKSMYPSLMCAHEPDQRIYNVDANGAIPEIVNRMLVGSQVGTLDLLPALPAALPAGSIRGILARGQIRIDLLSWDQKARTLHLELTSAIEQTVLLRVPGIDGVKTIRSSSIPFQRMPAANSVEARLPAGRKVTVDIAW